MTETQFTHEMAEELYKEHKGKPFFEELVDSISGGPATIMILTKENAVEEWRSLMGPADPELAKQAAPASLRATFAKNILQNAVGGSANEKQALESISYLFGERNLDEKPPAGSSEESTSKHPEDGEVPRPERAIPPRRRLE